MKECDVNGQLVSTANTRINNLAKDGRKTIRVSISTKDFACNIITNMKLDFILIYTSH